MPTVAQIRLPAPKSWDEFEAIVASALGTREHLEGPHRYGRTGQNQQGIDVYLIDAYSRGTGVQCKCVKSFLFADVEAAVTLAEKFSPKLDALTLALALPRDATLQAQVFALSKERAKEKKFRVGLWFWDDIVDELSRDVNELARHYPQFFAGANGMVSGNEHANDSVTRQQLDAYKELWSYFHGRLLPTRTHPDYDWGDAREDIALFLGRHADQLRQLHLTLGSHLPSEVADLLSAAANAAEEGAFVISPIDPFEMPKEALDAADLTYERLRSCLAELRTALGKRGVRLDPT